MRVAVDKSEDERSKRFDRFIGHRKPCNGEVTTTVKRGKCPSHNGFKFPTQSTKKTLEITMVSSVFTIVLISYYSTLFFYTLLTSAVKRSVFF